MIRFTRFTSLCLLVTFLAAQSEAADLKINGTLVPVLTGCDEHGFVKYSTIIEYAKLLGKWNVTSILVGGDISEGTFLGLKDLKKLIRAWVKAGEDYKFKVCVVIGNERPYEDLLELVEYCGFIKVAALFIHPPKLYYNIRPTAEDFVNYNELIYKTAGNLPLVSVLTDLEASYDPVYKYVNITEVYSLLSKRLPKVFIGVWCNIDTALILRYENNITKRTTCVFGAVATRAVFELQFNCSISPIANVVYPLFKKIELSVQKGDSDTAIKTQIKINQILAIISRYIKGGNFVALLKVCIKIVMGLDLGPSVYKQFNISVAVQKAITKELKALGITLLKPVN